MEKNSAILAISGSASPESANLSLLNHLGECFPASVTYAIIEDLAVLPHFRTDLTDENIPEEVQSFRKAVEDADGIVICSPEYVFGIPARLKNALEWCVSETVFSNKPVAVITASAHGEKGHEDLQLILKTIQAKISPGTSLLVPGVKSKTDENGNLTDPNLQTDLEGIAKKLLNAISG